MPIKGVGAMTTYWLHDQGLQRRGEDLPLEDPQSRPRTPPNPYSGQPALAAPLAAPARTRPQRVLLSERFR